MRRPLISHTQPSGNLVGGAKYKECITTVGRDHIYIKKITFVFQSKCSLYKLKNLTSHTEANDIGAVVQKLTLA